MYSLECVLYRMCSLDLDAEVAHVECGAQAVEHMHATLLKGVEHTSLARKLSSPVAARAAAAVAAATRMLDEQGLAGNATNATNATVCVCV